MITDQAKGIRGRLFMVDDGFGNLISVSAPVLRPTEPKLRHKCDESGCRVFKPGNPRGYLRIKQGQFTKDGKQVYERLVRGADIDATHKSSRGA